MRIGCLQFSPELGKAAGNVEKANSILEASSPQDLDLLVLPELAFTGYNHPSLSSIAPHLEPTAAGLSATWARSTATRLKCVVTVGYPELFTAPPALDNSSSRDQDGLTAYNSTVTVSPEGKVLAHYRKTHLYYTDETWAQESPSSWLSTPLAFTPKTTRMNAPVQASFGICMDLNPYRFTAPWTAYEFSSHALASGSEIVVLSMAWLTRLSAFSLASRAEEPDLDTLSYWIERLKPLVEGEKEVVVVCANRSGEEGGRNPIGEEEGVRYAGTSWIGKVGKGMVMLWGTLGAGEESILVADTETEACWALRTQVDNKPRDMETM